MNSTVFTLAPIPPSWPKAAPMYTIRFDPVRCIFYLKLNGFWTMATVVHFAAEMLFRTTAVRLKQKRFAMLSDATDFPIQSAAVSARFDRIMARGIEMDVGPCAIVVGSQLNKLQAERVFGNERVKMFTDLAEAEAWLAVVWKR